MSQLTTQSASGGDMHGTTVRYHFDDTDMDFTFGSMVLGAISHGGAEAGEAYYAAGQIQNGSAESWQTAWIALGERVARRGVQALKKGHRVSGCRQLMRASNYYRFGLLAMMPEDERLRPTAAQSRELMRKAGELMEPRLEYFEIPFAEERSETQDGKPVMVRHETTLPCYFRAAANDGKPHKTLLMLGGGETFAEDLVFYIMPEAIERGYNFMTLDMPGQGLMPLQGWYFRPQMWKAVSAALDALCARPEVDGAKLAAYGISGGGGFAPQAAEHDPRIKAVVMNACVVDAEPLFASMSVTSATTRDLRGYTTFHANTVRLVNWRWHVDYDYPHGLIAANRGFTFTPEAIKVPALILAGWGEYHNNIEAHEQMEAGRTRIPGATMIIGPEEEGATNHVIMENRSLMAQEVFDWLDAIFDQ